MPGMHTLPRLKRLTPSRLWTIRYKCLSYVDTCTASAYGGFKLVAAESDTCSAAMSPTHAPGSHKGESTLGYVTPWLVPSRLHISPTSATTVRGEP